MKKVIQAIVFIAGLGLGALLTWKLLEVPSGPGLETRPELNPPTLKAPARVVAPPTLDASNAPPAAASLANISAYNSEFDQTLALLRLIEHHDADAIFALIDEAGRVISGTDYLAATAIMLGRVAELDFQRALAYVLDAPPSRQQRWLHSIFHAAARTDPETAASALSDLPHHLRTIAKSAMMRSVDHLPMKTRIELADAIGAPMPLVDPRLDPQGAWTAARQARDARARLQQLLQVAHVWSETDPLAAMNAAAQLPPMERRQIEPQILANWISLDMDTAWSWLETQPNGDRLFGLYRIAMQRTADIDLNRAREIAANLSPQLKSQALHSIASTWAREDPYGLSEWLKTELSAGERLGLVSYLTGQFAMESPEVLNAWLATLDPEARGLAEMAVVNYAGMADPRAALRHIDNIQSPTQQEKARRRLMSTWSGSDPQAAREWYDTLPASERAGLTLPLINGWARWQPEAALGFARRIEDQTEREAALLSIVSQAPNSDMDMLVSIFDELENEKNRGRAGMIIYHQLKQRDPERAREFESFSEANQPPIR